MSVYGGLRMRYIHGSLVNMIEDSLAALNWFSDSNSLIVNPLSIVSSPIDPLEEILPNKIFIGSIDMDDLGGEMGSSHLSDYHWDFFVDVIAENESVGTHLSGDIFNIVRGKLGSVGRSAPVLNVYDLSGGSGEPITVCDIEHVHLRREKSFEKPFHRYWWSVGFTLIDSFYGEVG